MKKIYLSFFSLAIAIGANAQEKATMMSAKNVQHQEATNLRPTSSTNSPAATRATVIWENSFNNAADWVLDHDAAASALDWQIGVNSCTGDYPIADIVSTTVADGYLLLDSDAYGGATGGTEVEDSWATTANPIDMTGVTYAAVQFEEHYRRFNSETTYIVVGIGDGAGNVVWPDLLPDTDISAMSNVFFANSAVDAAGTGSSSENPEIRKVNISPALVGLTAAQQADIYIRFHWTGTWGYAWFVDDVKVIEQPLDDVQNISSYIVGVTNDGIEYGYTPEVQLDSDWTIGSTVYNFGVNDQTNVTLDAVFNGFTSSSSTALIESDSTRQVEATESALGMTAGTTYAGTFSVEAGVDAAGGPEFSDNVGLREMRVTDFEYAMDGIGVYTNSDLTSIGTNSFNDDDSAPVADAMFVAAQYMIKSTASVSAIKVMLANGSVVGGEMYGSIIDTTDFLADNPTPIVNTLPGVIAQFNLDAGYILLNFPAPYSLAPGAYYAAAELYSNANFADIRVLDDRTVAEPSTASMIYLPGTGLNTSYTNGTAFGVRLLMEGFVDDLGINDVSLDGISVYPNPSEGIVNISNDNNNDNIITVYDMLGKVVYSTTSNTKVSVDLSANGTGVYLVKVSNENGSVVERVVIK